MNEIAVDSAEWTNVKDYWNIPRVSIFQNWNALTAGYHPESIDEILFREDQIRSLKSTLNPIFYDCKPGNIFIYGKTGTGKTVTVRAVTKKLENDAESLGLDIGILTLECEENPTTYKALKSLRYQIEEILERPHERIPYSYTEEFELLRKLMKKFSGYLVIVFDEVDHLHEPEILNQFARLQENGHLKQGVCIICISNDEFFMEHLRPATQGSVSARVIEFPTYSRNELSQIMRFRMKTALVPEAFDEETLAECVDEAMTSKNIRDAFSIIHRAAKNAEETGRQKITVNDIRSSKKEIKEENLDQDIHDLGNISKIILYSIICFDNYYKHVNKSTNIKTRNLTNLTIKICRLVGIQPILHNTVWKHTKELEEMGLIITNKASEGKSAGVANEIYPGIDPRQLKEILFEDPMISVVMQKMPTGGLQDFYFN